MICKYANIHKKNPEFKVNKIKKNTKPKYIFICIFLKDKNTFQDWKTRFERDGWGLNKCCQTINHMRKIKFVFVCITYAYVLCIFGEVRSLRLKSLFAKTDNTVFKIFKNHVFMMLLLC